MRKQTNRPFIDGTQVLIPDNNQLWELLSPVCEYQGEKNKLVPRPDDFNEKTICLLDNHKPNANVFLERIGEWLKIRFKDINIFNYEKNKTAEPAVYDRFVKKKSDLVIVAQCD